MPDTLDDLIRERNELERQAIDLGRRWLALDVPLAVLRPIAYEPADSIIYRASGG